MRHVYEASVYAGACIFSDIWLNACTYVLFMKLKEIFLTLDEVHTLAALLTYMWGHAQLHTAECTYLLAHSVAHC